MCKCPTSQQNVKNNETWLKLRFCFRLVQQNKHCNSRTQSEAEGLIKCCNKTVFNGQSLFQHTSQLTGIKGFNYLCILEQKNHIPAGLILCRGYVNQVQNSHLKNVFPRGWRTDNFILHTAYLHQLVRPRGGKNQAAWNFLSPAPECALYVVKVKTECSNSLW